MNRYLKILKHLLSLVEVISLYFDPQAEEHKRVSNFVTVLGLFSYR